MLMMEFSKLVKDYFNELIETLPFNKTRTYINIQLPLNIYKILDKPPHDNIKPGIL